MEYAIGEVWWGPAPQKSGPAYRPWVIISDTRHPFSREESIALGMTTQQHDQGITVPDSDWVEGASDKTSYISPWYVITIKHRDFDRCQGQVSRATVEEAVAELHSYTALDE